MSPPPVRVSGLGRVGPDGRAILSGIDLELAAGSWTAIVGPSGGGKTTLLSVLGALDAGYSGTVELFAQDLASLDDDARTRLRRRRIGFVYQAFHLMESWSVRENVSAPLWLDRVTPTEQRLQEVLEPVGLHGRADDPVRGMSGGERQRVALARALVNAPGLLVADEPTGNLDRETGRKIMDVLEGLRERRPELAIVMATHDLQVTSHADRTLILRDRRLYEEAE